MVMAGNEQTIPWLIFLYITEFVSFQNNIYNSQLDSISENKMAVVSYLPILAVWCWNLGPGPLYIPILLSYRLHISNTEKIFPM